MLQGWILRYGLNVEAASGNETMSDGVARTLIGMNRPELLKLRDAAIELQQIIERELQGDRFDEDGRERTRLVNPPAPGSRR